MTGGVGTSVGIIVRAPGEGFSGRTDLDRGRHEDFPCQNVVTEIILMILSFFRRVVIVEGFRIMLTRSEVLIHVDTFERSTSTKTSGIISGQNDLISILIVGDLDVIITRFDIKMNGIKSTRSSKGNSTGLICTISATVRNG